MPMHEPAVADPARSAGSRDGAFGPVLRLAGPLLASVLLLMVGAGLQASLLGIRADDARFDPTVVGVILGVYYLGYVGGSLWVPTLIRRVGHIRVFGALASVAAATVVIHAVWVSPVPWLVLRFCTGVCMAGLFVVSESWLHDISTARTRATLLAVYNSVVTAGLAIGSVLLNAADTGGFVLFVVASSVVSIAAVPVALASHLAPVATGTTSMSLRSVWQAAPLGLLGGAMSGFGTGCALGFGAVFATRAGFGVSGASQFVAVVLLGAVVGQVPLGHWADRGDRHRVLAATAVVLIVGSAGGWLATDRNSFAAVLAAGMLIGAGAFGLYGLSYAHMADHVAPPQIIAAGGRLITVNGLGAAAGPITAALALRVVGDAGFFVVLLAVASAFLGTLVVRRPNLR